MQQKTINFKASLAFLCISLLACIQIPHAQAAGSFPKFRNQQSDPKSSAEIQGLKLRLLSDADFPPFSFQAEDGLQKGIAVDLAKAACLKLRVTCELKLLPFEKLLPALLLNEGDMIVSGFKVDADLMARADVTRAYYVSSGTFVARKDAKRLEPAAPDLAGRKLGYVKDTAHARFIERYYPKSDLRPFANLAEMLEALKSGMLDAAFGDTMQIGFWLKGSASGGCCAPLSRPFIDHATVSRGLVFTVSKDRVAVRNGFDAALDQLEEEGVTAEIFARYAPVPLW